MVSQFNDDVHSFVILHLAGDLNWIDGVGDIFTRVRDGLTRDTGYYNDPRGGDWILQSYGPAFLLRNIENGNTIVFHMNLNECKGWEYSYCRNADD